MKLSKMQYSDCKIEEKNELMIIIYSQLKDLSKEYPQFDHWFHHTVYPQLELGERELIMLREKENIAGMLILKNSEEKKICTLRVNPNYRHQGIGKLLFYEAFETLKTDKPMITVSENRIFEFKNILQFFNFHLEEVYYNQYKQGKAEFSYNGLLTQSLERRAI